MAILSKLTKEYQTLAVVGMAKNAGKTTTLNYLIEKLRSGERSIGITSTGRDGEPTDIVTGTSKPKIYLYEGMIVSVPTGLFKHATAELEILQMTKYEVPLGTIMICRVVDEGYVQIAGPVFAAEQLSLANDMRKFGAELILIDGAVDRRAIASPKTADAIVLATGAVISRDIQKIAMETAHVMKLYSLSEIDDVTAKALENREQITIINEKTLKELDVKTALLASSLIDNEINEDTKYVYIPGALTSSVIANIHPKKFKHTTFIVADATKIFLKSDEWNQLIKKGLSVKVLKKIDIIAISVNPMSPQGYVLEHEKLLKVMQEAMPDVEFFFARSVNE